MFLEKEIMAVMSSWQERELEEAFRVLPQHHQPQLERVKQIIQHEQREESVGRAGAELSTAVGLAHPSSTQEGWTCGYASHF